jgi:hypothetical protein
MALLTKPFEHHCTHPVTEHYISAADDRWHCHVAGCTCSRPRTMPGRHHSGALAPADEQLWHDVDVVSEMRFFGIDAKMTRDGIVIHRAGD